MHISSTLKGSHLTRAADEKTNASSAPYKKIRIGLQNLYCKNTVINRKVYKTEREIQADSSIS